MRCGAFLLAGQFPGQDTAAALHRSADAVVAAEAAGFADAWIAEHHFMPYGVCPSAITFAAHALGRTRTITLGTAVSVLSTAHPVALAEQVLLLDQLARGRFHLGVGRGGPWVDLEVFGTGLGRRDAGFAEGLDLLLRALSDERVAADGQRFRFREVPMVPRAWTRPRPAVTVACTSAATVELAARRGLPMLLGLDLDDDDKAHLVGLYRKAAGAAGRDPDRVRHIGATVCQVAGSRAQARSALLAALPGWLAQGLAAYRPVGGRPAPRADPASCRAYAERLCTIGVLGTPDECVERLLAGARRTGIDHVVLMVEGTGDRAKTLDAIARIGADVLPHLGRRLPDPGDRVRGDEHCSGGSPSSERECDPMSDQDQDKGMLDKAKDMAGGLRDKVGDFFDGNEEKIDGAVDKAGDFVDDKTGGRFSEHTDKAQNAAKGAVDKLGNDDDPQ
jgi:alkanesulfonate monooxygenase SsuD/methylene tetrahydromethanopterin reductase-like flavin-dependent oxidoreductase (luciferase family)